MKALKKIPMLPVAMVLNFLIAAWLYPEFFMRLDFRGVEGHETGGPLQYVFYLIGQFYQGNVQLFNRYDLVNTSFAQLSVGVYTPFNFIVALGYVIFSSLVDNPAQFFHHWYVFVYYALGLCLRTFGFYLLTFYMTKSRMTAVLSTILANCFCAITLIHMGGVCISSVYNYMPLLLFCLVYYWQTRSFKSILASILVFVLAANHAMYVGFGFFYQTVHLFLFDMLMIWLLFQRKTQPLMHLCSFNWRDLIKAGIVIALIFLPVFWWAHSTINDFEMIGSGLGDSEGRFKRIFNPHAMLSDPLRYFVSSPDVFRHAYDFTVSGWYLSGAFLGIMIMVLAVIGLILGKHTYKPIFITAAIMMAFLNVPSNQGGWMMWAHWLDAITNPFCFLVRSFHYAVLLWYVTIVLPVGLGIFACVALIKNQYDRIYAKRVILVKVVLAIALLAAFFIPKPVVKAYAIAVLSLFLMFFVAIDLKQLKKPLRFWLIGGLLFGIVGIEFAVLKTYIHTPSVDMNWAYWDGLRVKPRQHGPMYTPTPVIADYQNPKILPVRFYYRTDKQTVLPLMWDFQEMFGQFYHFMPLALRSERESSVYIPRHKTFTKIDKDTLIKEYIARDGRVMYMADAAIKPNPKDFASVLAKGLDRQVVMVEGANADKAQDFKDIQLPAVLAPSFKYQDYPLLFEDAKVNNTTHGKVFQWKLPKDFPTYLSTSIFTPDVQLWQLTVGDRLLTPAQGAVVHPGTFDVNNVRHDYVTALMPADVVAGQQQINLRVWQPREFVDVWRNTQDEFGFTYDVKRDGWWVMHMPYDPKWQLFIDGVKTPITKVNGYFIGAPLSKGEHQIYLTYWPNSPLRWMIVLSTILSFLTMIVVFIATYRWSQE